MNITTTLLETTGYQPKPTLSWDSVKVAWDERSQIRLERWLLNGVDDLPSPGNENPVDTLSTYLADVVFVGPDSGTRDTQAYKDAVSWALSYKRWWLWGCPKVGAVVTVVDDTVGHTYPIGTKLRVTEQPFLDDYTTERVEGETVHVPMIRVFPAEEGTRFQSTFLTFADIEDWRTPAESTSAPIDVDREQRLVDVFSEVYNQAADARGWCSEAEEVTRAANEALAAAGFTVTLKQRETVMEGYLDVPLEVTVRMPFQVTVPRGAEDEDVRQALIRAYTDDTRTSDQMVREALTAGATGTWALGYVSIEWMDSDFDEVHWDARPA